MSSYTAVFKHRLTKKMRHDLSLLHQLCRKNDGGSLSSGIKDPADNYLLISSKDAPDILAYSAVFDLGDSYLVYSHVHPSHRQKGIFTLMLKALTEKYPNLPLVFAASENCPALLHMIEQNRFVCHEKQHLLVYDIDDFRARNDNTKDVERNNIIITASDQAEFLASIHIRIFDEFPSEEVSQVFIENMMVLSGNLPYTFKDEKDRVLGMSFVLTEDSSACLCSFGILPELQKQGYGRKCLEAVCRMLSENPNVVELRVQVDGENVPALSLYEGFGFKKKDAFTSFRFVG